ncbi:hypothetical protein A2W24_01655 [Microgenomates group bacterium RBG_16_45_19]|nr:MAG: hypothetical protein A2W24_01655 [Microgenomates group bacterium RBG_16_45_19]
MGLEKTKRGCFGYHLGQCRGACVGREPAAKYNLRVLKALKQKKMLDWPFAGVIAIREENEVNDRAVTHIFDNWQHLGTISDEAEINTPGVWAQFTPGVNKSRLDLDTYKILKRYLQANVNRVRLVSGDKIKSWITD